MKRLIHILSVIFIILTILLSRCRREEFDWSPIGSGTIETEGAIDIPAYLDQSRMGVYSGTNSGIISDGEYKIKLNENTVQLVSIVDKDEQPILMSVNVTGSESSSVKIGPESTAEALVFLFPLFCTSDIYDAEDLKDMIHSISSFQSLVNTIKSNLENNPSYLTDENPLLLNALSEVIIDLMAEVDKRISENTKSNLYQNQFAPIPDLEVNGLKINSLVQNGDNLSFKISNRRKRWISVYVDKSTDGTNFVPSTHYEDIIPSASLSIWNIYKMRLSDLSSLPPENSEQINISTSGYKAFSIKCYGLGVHNLVSNFEDQEMHRLIEPAIYSAVLDITIPVIEVVLGFRGLASDIRGRPADDPCLVLMNKIKENIFEEVTIGEDMTLLAKLVLYYRTGDYCKALSEIGKRAIAVTINNPSLISQMIVKNIGLNVTRAAVSNVFIVFKIGKAVFQVVNITYSLGSLFGSEAVTVFRLDEFQSSLPVTVSGTVKSYKTSSPIAGAYVSSYNQDGALLQGVYTDSNGHYTFYASTGYLMLRVAAHGYKSTNQVLEIPADIINQNPVVYYPQITWLSSFSSELGDVGGVVKDATNLISISGVSVKLRYGINDPDRELVQEVISDSNGSFLFTSVPSGTYTAFFSKPGYIDDYLVISVLGGQSTSEFEMNLSPDIHTNSGYRIVLTWGENPRDLDSHLFTPYINGYTFHIYYGNKGNLSYAPYANLDVDDVTSYGPETITIATTFRGEYYYSVYHYAGSGSLSTTSDASVTLYGTGGLIRSWHVPSTGNGLWWNVFSLDGSTGSITNINSISSNPPTVYKGIAEADMKSK